MVSLLVTLSTLLALVNAGDVALFASSGCYSHDVMMREVGEQFTRSNVTWLQAYLFEFGFGEMKIPSHWGRVQVTRTLNNVAEMNELGGFLVWLGNVPLHWERWWDLRGASFFLEILKYHQRYCEDFVKSKEFLDYKQSNKVDLLVIDHFLQECMVGAASLLNASTVQFSNWPIADGYITSLNVPANPSSTPKIGNAFSSTKTMEFGIRVKNTIFHSLIVLARVIQSYVVQLIYKSWGYEVDIIDVEAKHIMYASRGEFLAEPVRPLNNRIKYFGCSRCGDPEQYKIRRPAEFIPSTASPTPRAANIDLTLPTMNITIPSPALLKSYNISLCSKCEEVLNLPQNTTRSAEASTGRVLSVQETRWIQNKLDFPLIDWNLLEEKPFVLVSFGSVAHAKYMPDALFDRFLEDFGKSPHTILWQTNDVTERLRNRTIPQNLHIIRWVPMKVMLAHHNLHFAMLHCGVNTVNELLSFGIPILAVPMQGDQPSNSRRLKDLGLADIASIADFWAPDGLANVMAEFENGLEERRRRSRLIAEMISDYRALHGSDQHFWLEWAKTHGKMFRDRAKTLSSLHSPRSLRSNRPDVERSDIPPKMPNPYAKLESTQQNVLHGPDSAAEIKNLPDLFCDTLQSTPVPKKDLLLSNEVRNNPENIQSTPRVVLTEENPYNGLTSVSQVPITYRNSESIHEINNLPVEFRTSSPNPYRAITNDPSQRLVNPKMRYGDSLYEIYKLPRQFYSGNPYGSDSDNSELTNQSIGDDTFHENQLLPNPFKRSKRRQNPSDGTEDTDEDIRKAPSLPKISSKTRTGREKSDPYLPASAFAPENRRHYQAFSNKPQAVDRDGYSSSDSAYFGEQRPTSTKSNPYRHLRKNKPSQQDGHGRNAPPYLESLADTLVECQNVPDYFDTTNAYAVVERDETQRPINQKLRSSASQYEIDTLPEVFPPRRRRGPSVSSKYSDGEATYCELNDMPDQFEEKPRYLQSNSQYFARPEGGMMVFSQPLLGPTGVSGQPNNVYSPYNRLGNQPNNYNYQYRPALSDSSVAELNALPDVFDQMCRIQAEAALAVAKAAQHAANVAVYQANQVSRHNLSRSQADNNPYAQRSAKQTRSDIEELRRMPDPFISKYGKGQNFRR